MGRIKNDTSLKTRILQISVGRWQWMHHIPVWKRGKYWSNPGSASPCPPKFPWFLIGHYFGSTADPNCHEAAPSLRNLGFFVLCAQKQRVISLHLCGHVWPTIINDIETGTWNHDCTLTPQKLGRGRINTIPHNLTHCWKTRMCARTGEYCIFTKKTKKKTKNTTQIKINYSILIILIIIKSSVKCTNTANNTWNHTRNNDITTT